MKISVDLSDSESREILKITGEKKKGPAIRKLLVEVLMLKRRERMAQKFINNDWGVDLKTFESGQEKDRDADEARDKHWRS